MDLMIWLTSESALLFIAMLVLTVAILREMRRGEGVVVGAMAWSLARHAIPISLATLAAMAITWSPRLANSTRDMLDFYSAWELWLVPWLAIILLGPFLIVVQSAASRRPRAALLAQTVPLLLLLAFDVAQDSFPRVPWDRGGNDYTWIAVPVPGRLASPSLWWPLAILTLLQLFRLPHLLQCIHTRLRLGERESGEVVGLVGR
jgi:hypothetical protein